jgi:hypothetical protein
MTPATLPINRIIIGRYSLWRTALSATRVPTGIAARFDFGSLVKFRGSQRTHNAGKGGVRGFCYGVIMIAAKFCISLHDARRQDRSAIPSASSVIGA